MSITGQYYEYDSGYYRLRKSKFQINTAGNPKIFSGGHETLDSNLKGFYLSQDGLSIGSKVYIDDTGTMRLGTGATTNTGKHWVIDGGSGYNSSISYVNTNDDTESVYIGTDIIRLGKLNNGKYPFSVTNKGKLYAKDAEIEGKITANEGKIAGWTIDGSTLQSQNNRVRLNAEGSHTIEGGSGYIDLGGGGDFAGIHLNASQIVFSANGIGVTGSRGGTAISMGDTREVTYVTGVTGTGSRETGWSIVTSTSKLKFIDGIFVGFGS